MLKNFGLVRELFPLYQVFDHSTLNDDHCDVSEINSRLVVIYSAAP